MAETKRIFRRVKTTDEMMMNKQGLTDLKDMVAAQQLMELSNSSSTEESINSSSNNNIKEKYNMKNHEERSIQNQKQQDNNDGDENESEVKVETHQIRQMKRKRFRSISDIYSRTRPLNV